MIMSEYFNGYKYSYIDISTRGNKNYGTQYGLFEISKKDLLQNEVNSIYSKLESDGWNVVDSKINYRSFCHGENISLDILYPITLHEKNSKGVPIEFYRVDVWNIYIYKRTVKIPECNKSLDIVDFTKI